MNNEILSKMKCPSCARFMIAPIFVCSGGHSLCGRCYLQVQKCPQCSIPLAIRNYELESLVGALAISNPSVRECPYMKYGCKQILQSCDYNGHKSKCPYKMFECMFYTDENKLCTYVAKRLVSLKQHVLCKHEDDVFDIEADMQPIELPFQRNLWFVCHKEDIFYLHVQEKDGIMYWWLQHLNAPRKAKYSYTIRVFSKPYTHREYQCKENCVAHEDFDSVISNSLCPSIPTKVLETYPDDKWYTVNIYELPHRK